MSKQERHNSIHASRQLIQYCKDKGYRFGINTARLHISRRAKRYLRNKLGLDLRRIPKQAIKKGRTTVQKKVKALMDIQRFYGVPYSFQVVFFEDKSKIVAGAKLYGFTTIQPKSGMLTWQNVVQFQALHNQ
ncbi:MAG: HAD family hydrolase [Gammaproteobacteria bacterium]|nr:HAD family hydrolase [Gammaproteobacteria bacterium]